MTRIGTGFDVHAFGPGDHVVIGGARISFQRGLAAHSDGDVLIHAVMDALLGAVARGDIGQHFPPDNPAWKDADSRRMLRQVIGSLHASGWQVVNTDAVVICEQPKLAPHIDVMRANLAADMSVGVDRVSVKATTTERIGFTGRGEGIACHAVALVEHS